MRHAMKLILELTLLFVFLPVMTLFPMHRGIKAALLLIGVGYIIALCLKEKMFSKITSRAMDNRTVLAPRSL